MFAASWLTLTVVISCLPISSVFFEKSSQFAFASTKPGLNYFKLGEMLLNISIGK